MKRATLLALATLAGGLAPRSAPQSTPRVESAQTCRRDQSGIEWVLPFGAARAKAASEQRLLFLKPIAFGTSADGGW